MKYKDYIESYVGKPVKIYLNIKLGIYTISPARLNPKRPYARDDILEVHDDFVLIQEYLGGYAPPKYAQWAIPIYRIICNP